MTTLEIIFRIIELVLTIVGLVLVIFGWIIPSKESAKANQKRMKYESKLELIKWKKEYVDKQISDFYGPIYSLLLENTTRFNLVQYQLGREVIIPQGKDFSDLPEEEKLVWKHYVDTYMLDTEMKIVEILKNNFHLLNNYSDLDICKVFIDYVLGWEMLSNQKKNNVPNYYDYYYRYNYPSGFNKMIKDTLLKLQNEKEKLEEELQSLNF